MRKFNTKLFLALTGGAALAVAGLFVVHYFQAGRIARALLWQAGRAEEDGKPREAVKYLGRYLDFQPRDTETRARLGRLLASDQLAVTPRARENARVALEQVLNREPDRHDLRRLVIRLGMSARPPLLKSVKEHLDVLTRALPEDAEVAHLLGAYYEAAKDEPDAAAKAVAAYRQAVARGPARVESYLRLAAVLAKRPKGRGEADAVMDALVAANPKDFRAYLHRGRYYLDREDQAKAGQDLARARELAPDDADVLLAAGKLDQARNQPGDARRHYQRGKSLHPRDKRFYLALADVAIRAKDRPQAEKDLREGANNLQGPDLHEILWELGNLYLDDGDLPRAEGVIAQLTKGQASPAMGTYLQARAALVREDWAKAVRLLEQTRLTLEASSEASPALLNQTDLYLGHCYDRLNEPTRQLDAFNRVVERDPASEAGRLGVAAAQRTLGRIDASLEQYRQLERLGRPSAERHVEEARLRMEQIFLQGEGDFKPVEEALDRAEKINPDLPDVVLLRARVLMVRDKIEPARALLTKALEGQPKRVEFLVALSELAQRQKDWPAAWELLNRAEAVGGAAAVDVRLARASFWANRRTHESGPALAKLGDGAGSLPEDEQARLLQGLAEASFRLGNVKEAEDFWRRLAEMPRYRKDLRLQLLLFELAMQAGNEAGVQRALDTIGAIEGPQGTLARFGSALRLIGRAQKGETGLLDEARALLDQVAAQRPAWPAVLLAKADIERLKGNTDQAVNNYRKAYDLGDHSARAVRPLVQLLYQSQRYEEAEKVIQAMRQSHRQTLTNDLQRLWADVSVRNHKPTQGLELALGAVAADSNDYRDFLWLGQILAAAGNRAAEAEEKFRRAVALAETVPETWVALVQFLVATDQKLAAQAEVERARAKLPAGQRPLALAQCYEAVGQAEQAEKFYQEARQAKPEDVPVLRAVAGFHMRQARPQLAEPILQMIADRRVQAAPADVAWARRGLALVLVAGGKPEQFTRALALVGLKVDDAGKLSEGPPPAGDDPAEEQRARARVLAAAKSRALRARAVALLEELDRRQALLGDDRFLLVQLYEADKIWPRAGEHLRVLLRQYGLKPLYLAHYAQGLIQQGKPDESERFITELEKQERQRGGEPGSLGSIDLKVMTLRARGRHNEAVELLRQRLARTKPPKAEELIFLINYLAREKRLPEALQWCDQAWESLAPEVAAGVSVNALRNNSPTAQQYARVDDRLRAALQKKPGAVGILLPLADLEDLRGRYQEAERLYQDILRRDPANGVALNNLAWLLAFRSGDPARAGELIDKAIQVAGPSPEFLDTRAVVFLALKQPDRAVADLERAANLDRPTWYRYFHTARAKLMANQPDAAVAAFRKAKELGLRRDLLHPVEQIACAAVFDELERR